MRAMSVPSHQDRTMSPGIHAHEGNDQMISLNILQTALPFARFLSCSHCPHAHICPGRSNRSNRSALTSWSALSVPLSRLKDKGWREADFKGKRIRQEGYNQAGNTLRSGQGWQQLRWFSKPAAERSGQWLVRPVRALHICPSWTGQTTR